MPELGAWLTEEMARREVTPPIVSVHAGVAPVTIREILDRGHVPRPETLFRLAEYFDVSREFMLRLAGYLPARDDGEDTRLGPKVVRIAEMLGDLPLSLQQHLADQFIAQVEMVREAYRAGVESGEKEA